MKSSTKKMFNLLLRQAKPAVKQLALLRDLNCMWLMQPAVKMLVCDPLIISAL